MVKQEASEPDSMIELMIGLTTELPIDVPVEINDKRAAAAACKVSPVSA